MKQNKTKTYAKPEGMNEAQEKAWAELPNDTMRGQFIRDLNAARMSAQSKEAKTPKAPKEPKTDKVLTMKVKILSEKNPKRTGSASAARFALYKSGASVEAYIAACVEATQQRRAARADIDWDTKHKFIELTD
jgi:hypothetical protein